MIPSIGATKVQMACFPSPEDSQQLCEERKSVRLKSLEVGTVLSSLNQSASSHTLLFTHTVHALLAAEVQP